MALAATFEKLHQELKKLHDALSALGITVAEDRPLYDAVALADRLSDIVDDAIGAAEGAVVLAGQAVQASRSAGRLATTRETLAKAHGLVLELERIFVEKLAAYDCIAELKQMGRERGGLWSPWVATVSHAILACNTPRQAVQNELLASWLELTEAGAREGILVQATNIGQQITLKEEDATLAAGVT